MDFITERYLSNKCLKSSQMEVLTLVDNTPILHCSCYKTAFIFQCWTMFLVEVTKLYCYN